VLATPLLVPGWERVERPASLFRRYEFASYRDTRAFLDGLAALSNETGVFPDLGFGRTHVNVTLYGAGGGAPGEAEIGFANRVAALAGVQAAQGVTGT
jgi:pterin-4a-carbinolamine dehydratase